jgi:enamine deaminase RidA (YjgF/YER057c/UK114 family)
MIKRSVQSHPAFEIYTTSLRNQLFISASVTQESADPIRAAEEIYGKIAELLSASSSQIVHERCFGNIEIQPQILNARDRALLVHGQDSTTPITFVEGQSCSAGIQIRALRPDPGTSIRTILDQGIPKGRAWNLNGSTFYIFQSVDGGSPRDGERVGRESQSAAMFRQAKVLLQSQGANYQDVVRTWIYISDILDWYDEFNAARNRCYSEYGFLGDPKASASEEQMYLPASTGIEGRNPSGLPATMDVFAVHRSPTSAIQIRPLYGIKQRSPFRYGSAFSRAVVVEEPQSKLILVSGTASIDEQGKSVFIDESDGQIRQTLNVVSTLIAPEGATLQDLCEATVFLKRKEDLDIYTKIAKEAGLAGLPSVNVVADVCRDELRFELDAAFILAKNAE